MISLNFKCGNSIINKIKTNSIIEKTFQKNFNLTNISKINISQKLFRNNKFELNQNRISYYSYLSSFKRESFLNHNLKNFSIAFENTKNNKNFNNELDSKLSPEEKELKKKLKNNEEKFSRLVLKLSADEEIKKDHLIYLEALSFSKFVEENDFVLKSRKMLLNQFRFNEYSLFNKPNFDEELFVNYFGKIYYLELEENDLAAIEKKYFEIKENLRIEQIISIYDSLYYFEHYKYNLNNIKNDVIDFLTKSYLVMSPESNFELNINIIFSNPKEISKFSLFAAEKLIQYTNFDYMPQILSLSHRLNFIQPLPKIIHEIQHSTTVPDKIKQKVINNCGDILNKFFKNIPKDDINDSILIGLSNTLFYGKMNSEILDLYLGGFYRNIANFEIENLLEMFFLILNTSINEKNHSDIKQKLINQLLIIFSTVKPKPLIILETHKYYIYINNCREILNKAFISWITQKEKELINMNENDKDLYERFKKLLKLSVDVYPFATKDLNYSEGLLEDLFLVFKDIVKKF